MILGELLRSKSEYLKKKFFLLQLLNFQTIDMYIAFG